MENKTSTYRGYTEAQARAHKNYISKFVEVKVRMDENHHKEVKAFVDATGQSMNKFINAAIVEKMARDKEKTGE